MNIFEQHVPKFGTRKKSFPPWFSGELKALIRCKERAFKSIKRYGESRQVYNDLRARIKHQKTVDFNADMENVQTSIVTNPKELWSYIPRKKNTTRRPGKMNFNGMILDEAQ